MAESSLGKLARWLRLAGFDTRLDHAVPDIERLHRMARQESRIVLTRTHRIIRHIEQGEGLFISSDIPLEQVRQVLGHFNLQLADLKPFSRCAICNQVLRAVPKSELPGTVPDYVRQHHNRFLACGRCRRVYWRGTHSARTSALIQQWFLPGLGP